MADRKWRQPHENNEEFGIRRHHIKGHRISDIDLHMRCRAQECSAFSLVRIFPQNDDLDISLLWFSPVHLPSSKHDSLWTNHTDEARILPQLFQWRSASDLVDRIPRIHRFLEMAQGLIALAKLLKYERSTPVDIL